MRFLVVTKSRSPAPPNPDLVYAMLDWVDQHTKSGKIEQTWTFAGLNGGGGILNVGSHEELDTIMGGFPFGPFSKIEVYALADLQKSLETSKEQFAKMAEMTRSTN